MDKGILKIERSKLYIIPLILCAFMLVFFVSVYKYREGEINYYNSDATWHTLLTIEAYRENPVSQHLFLPIVSLGDIDDKYIPWGATISDDEGNYYYTSFSSAGYFMPWLFMKIFKLPVTERSLYIFNSLLFAISAALWGYFIYIVFVNKSIYSYILSGIGIITYVLSPELLHGMGIVYWHQSIMQVTLLIQIIAYYKMCESDSKYAKPIFYLMAFVNPYIEWTGYVANVGFALAELITFWKQKRLAFRKIFIIGILTVFSGGLFIVHYLLHADASRFFEIAKNRFIDRSGSGIFTWTNVFGGYLNSFLYWWLLLLILIIWSFKKNDMVVFQHRMLLLVLAFPLVENIIMKGHACSYSYDRMKGIFVVSFVICELSYHLLKSLSRAGISVLITLLIIVGVMNLNSYIRNTSYIWEVNYRRDNQLLAEYISQNYADSVLGTEPGVSVRGYINLLFGRGVYEGRDAEKLKGIAAGKEKRYAISISAEYTGAWLWSLYDLGIVTIHDMQTGDVIQVECVDGNIYSTVLQNYE